MKRKWYSLMDKVWRMENLEEAWRSVKSNHGGCGVDKVTVEQFESNLVNNLWELQRLLREKRYKPLSVLRVNIPKGDGRVRPLGVPAVRDRVVQQALLKVLEPIFEAKFLDCSFGFRLGRSQLDAVNQVEYYREAEGCGWVVEADIEGFFDNVDPEMLLDFVNEEISDGSVLRLIRSWLEAGVSVDGVVEETRKGVPQGGPISPLLANIYLHPFDAEMTELGYRLVRYADDFVVMCRSEEEAVCALKDVERILSKLGLSVNADKTRTVELSDKDGIGFLGFRIFLEHKVPHEKAVRKFKDEVRRLTRRQQPVNVQEVVVRLNPVIRGWGNYFKHGNVNWLFGKLDGWVRMRLRSFMEKKKTPVSNYRIRNAHFEALGLERLSAVVGF